MRVTQDIPYRHRPLLQQRWGDHIVSGTGDGERSGQREPDAADRDRQMQLPAVPPAVIPRLAPGRFGVNGGMGDFACEPMFLVPDAPVGAQWCTVDGRRRSLGCPGLKQRDQRAPQTSNQRRQPRWQVRKAAFPGAPRGKPSVLCQQGTNLQRDGIRLLQKAEQGIGGIEAPHDHDDERLNKELVGIGFLSPALAFGERRWRWYLLNEPEYADKDATMS